MQSVIIVLIEARSRCLELQTPERLRRKYRKKLESGEGGTRMRDMKMNVNLFVRGARGAIVENVVGVLVARKGGGRRRKRIGVIVVGRRI